MDTIECFLKVNFFFRFVQQQCLDQHLKIPGMNYIEEEIFERQDFTESALAKGSYENCSFINCNFSSADLSEVRFVECEFRDCNMSMADFADTGFREVRFIDSKLLGLSFHSCNKVLFSATFENCLLNLSSFYKMNLKNAVFRNCSLHEADFTEADLTGALFDSCDLDRAIFSGTILEKADLRAAYNYSIDPDANKIRKARFSLEGIPGLLRRYDIVIE